MLKTSKCINYNFTSCLKLSGWWVWYFWDVKNKGPDAIGKFLFILWKICHQFSEILVDPLIFYPTKFCWALPISKGIIILSKSRTNFFQVWNLADFPIYKPWFERMPQLRKFDLAFQILVRFLVDQNKFWKPSVFRPLMWRDLTRLLGPRNYHNHWPAQGSQTFCV